MTKETRRELKEGEELKLRPQLRYLTLSARAAGASDQPLVDPVTRTIDLSFSSEEPVARWWGDEILSHKSGAANLSRLNDGAPLLFNHDMDDVIGVVESANIGTDKKGHATVRFAKTPRADEIVGMIDDGILRNVSFMYEVDDLVATERTGDGEATQYVANSWSVFEISIVSVPADQTIGIGRNSSHEEKRVQVTGRKPNAAAAATPSHEESMRTSYPLQNAVADGGAGGGAAAVASPSPEETRKAERDRCMAIETLGREHKLDPELVRGFIAKGATLEEVRGTVLDEILKRGASAAALGGAGSNPDLTNKEKARYSMMRAVRACIDKDWKGAGFERECSDEVAKRNNRDGSAGFFMPTNLNFAVDARTLSPFARDALMAQQRAQYSVSGAATGGVLVDTVLLAGSFIEILRNKAKVLQMGATMLTGLVGNIDLPRRSGAGTAYWVGDGKAIPEAESTFEKLGLTPKTIGAYSIITRNMLLQATPDIEMLARSDMLAVLALGIDAAALYGLGSSAQPMGIANTPGVNAVVLGTNGAPITLDNLIDMETAVTSSNAPENALAYMANAKTVGSLKKLKSTTGQYLWTGSTVGAQSGTPGEVNGYAVARTNQARSNLTKGTSVGVCSELYFGSWSELIFAEWGVLEVLPNPYGAGYTSGGIELRALQTVDIGTRHPASFSVISDALTP